MVKRILILLGIIGLLYGGYRLYTYHEQTLNASNGDVTCQGCDTPEEHARFLKENSGETADGNSERKTQSARVAALEAETGQTQPATQPAPGSPVVTSGNSTMISPSNQTSVYPAMPSTMTPSAPVVVPSTGQPGSMPVGLPSGLPARDSESPNAPNGTRFAGSGSYQWYRQGNLTWRVDTTTGRSCIIYATMDEWRKQIVMSHGCGRSA